MKPPDIRRYLQRLHTSSAATWLARHSKVTLVEIEGVACWPSFVAYVRNTEVTVIRSQVCTQLMGMRPGPQPTVRITEVSEVRNIEVPLYIYITGACTYPNSERTHVKIALNRGSHKYALHWSIWDFSLYYIWQGYIYTCMQRVLFSIIIF